MPVKRPTFRYAALALLFAMTLAYEFRYIRDVLRSEGIDVPFFLIPMLFHCAAGQRGISRLDVGGTVVGLLESYAYEQGSVSLAAGDILVAYTDGISEAMNAADEEWGEDRMMATVKLCDGLPAQDILQRILTAADAFVAGAKQHDDMTLVILRAV